jgi:hypothetical protein
MSIELDHIFCFCPKELSEAKAATSEGFKLTDGTQHPGQGTANRCILFHENYLELIFLKSQAEAEKNPLQLHQRASWRSSGKSPFGIALRGHLPQNEVSHFWEYCPPYWPSVAILIHKSNEEKPELPLIFIMPQRGDTPSDMHPIRRPNVNPDWFAHSTGCTRILGLQVEGPNYEWPLSITPRGIEFKNSPKPLMKVILDGKISSDLQLSETLLLTGQ